MNMPKCHDCGRFHKAGPGSAWKMVYYGYPPQPDREITRCLRCVQEHGQFSPQTGIKPDSSCGVFQDD